MAVTSLVDCEVLDFIRLLSYQLTDLFRVPCDGADSLSVHIVQGERLLFRLHIPHGDEAAATSCRHDVCNFFVPIQAVYVVRSCCGAAQSHRLIYIVKIGDKQLQLVSSCEGKSGASEPLPWLLQ